MPRFSKYHCFIKALSAGGWGGGVDVDGALKACEMERIRVAFWGKWAAVSCISADFLMLRFKSTDILASWLVASNFRNYLKRLPSR